jgi:hypothetical protein
MGAVSCRTATEQLVVVAVTESVHPALVNHDSITYVSPPQTGDQARTLVQLLVGRADDRGRDGRWSVSVPGGKRTVTIAAMITHQ